MTCIGIRVEFVCVCTPANPLCAHKLTSHTTPPSRPVCAPLAYVPCMRPALRCLTLCSQVHGTHPVVCSQVHTPCVLACARALCSRVHTPCALARVHAPCARVRVHTPCARVCTGALPMCSRVHVHGRGCVHGVYRVVCTRVRGCIHVHVQVFTVRQRSKTDTTPPILLFENLPTDPTDGTDSTDSTDSTD